MDNREKMLRVLFHLFLVLIPAIFGTLRNDWFVIPIVIVNGFIQGMIAGWIITIKPIKKI